MVEEAMGVEDQIVDGPKKSDAATKTKRSWIRRVTSFCWSLTLLGAFIAVGVLVGGFIRYASIVTVPVPNFTAKADGIVVLTGGENRLREGASLLSKGHSERLLVTGVNPNLSMASFQKVLGLPTDTLDCCVEIDRAAMDTIGNALATRQWNEHLDAKSLIVVTGAFHMPRAIKELSHALPDIKLIAAPVNVPDGEAWWKDRARLRDMVREYMKFSVIIGRDIINDAMDWPWPTMPGRNASSDALIKNANYTKELEPNSVSR
ncbi:MAG: YdcF family protein [Hyphomicrobiales bacterium]